MRTEWELGGKQALDERSVWGDLNNKLDWKYPVGAGLLGFLGGPSHF
jgi:hypothetical protein